MNCTKCSKPILPNDQTEWERFDQVHHTVCPKEEAMEEIDTLLNRLLVCASLKGYVELVDVANGVIEQRKSPTSCP